MIKRYSVLLVVLCAIFMVIMSGCEQNAIDVETSELEEAQDGLKYIVENGAIVLVGFPEVEGISQNALDAYNISQLPDILIDRIWDGGIGGEGEKAVLTKDGKVDEYEGIPVKISENEIKTFMYLADNFETGNAEEWEYCDDADSGEDMINSIKNVIYSPARDRYIGYDNEVLLERIRQIQNYQFDVPYDNAYNDIREMLNYIEISYKTKDQLENDDFFNKYDKNLVQLLIDKYAPLTR